MEEVVLTLLLSCIFHLGPGKLKGVELLSISHSQLNLSWSPPEKLNDVKGYNVTWKLVSNDKLQSVDGIIVNRTNIATEEKSYVIKYLGKYLLQQKYKIHKG